MTDTINDVAAAEQVPAEPATLVDQQQLAERLLAQAKEQGVELVGPDGLLNQLTKRVLETALEAEISEHLGYDKHHPTGRNHGNSRNASEARHAPTPRPPATSPAPSRSSSRRTRRCSRRRP